MKDFIITLIYDKVAKQYSSPLIYNNLDCAKRHFKQIIESNPSVANSGDYELYVLGYYDSLTGELYTDKSNVVLGCYSGKSIYKFTPMLIATFEGGVVDEKE